MRGDQGQQGAVFSYVQLEDRVPSDHPLREDSVLVDGVLRDLDRQFSELYSTTGRPSIPPERLLRALLLQYLYGVRSERLLMEQLDYNLLFRWFVGLGVDDRVWDATTFTKNRDRLLNRDLAVQFLESVVAAAQAEGLTSDEHFSVDGTLIQAWAGQKSFKRKGGDSESGARRWRAQPGGGLPRSAAAQQHASLDHGSGCSLVPQEQRAGIEAELPGPRGDREPERSGGGSRSDAGHRESSARTCSLMAEVPRAQRATVGGDRGFDVPVSSRRCVSRVSRRTSRRRSRAARSMRARPDTRAIGSARSSARSWSTRSGGSRRRPG